MKQITELEIIKYAELWLILEANILNSCCFCNLYFSLLFFKKFAILCLYFCSTKSNFKGLFYAISFFLLEIATNKKSLVLKASRSVLYENKIRNFCKHMKINCLPYVKALETCVLILLTFYLIFLFLLLFSLNVYLNPD